MSSRPDSYREVYAAMEASIAAEQKFRAALLAFGPTGTLAASELACACWNRVYDELVNSTLQ